jgi:hypothetical protein
MKAVREIIWPTADEVAHAIIAASRLEGEDPIAVLKGRDRSRARVYAFAALAYRFPQVQQWRVAMLTGVSEDRAASTVIAILNTVRDAKGKNARWWNRERFARIVEECGWPRPIGAELELRRDPIHRRFIPHQAAICDAEVLQ